MVKLTSINSLTFKKNFLSTIFNCIFLNLEFDIHFVLFLNFVQLKNITKFVVQCVKTDTLWHTIQYIIYCKTATFPWPFTYLKVQYKSAYLGLFKLLYRTFLSWSRAMRSSSFGGRVRWTWPCSPIAGSARPTTPSYPGESTSESTVFIYFFLMDYFLFLRLLRLFPRASEFSFSVLGDFLNFTLLHT